MSRLLYQGVEGVADVSESLRITNCHPEQSEGSASRAFSPQDDDPKLRE